MCSPWNEVTIEVCGTLLKQVMSSSILRNWEEAHVPVQQFHKETQQCVIIHTHTHTAHSESMYYCHCLLKLFSLSNRPNSVHFCSHFQSAMLCSDYQYHVQTRHCSNSSSDRTSVIIPNQKE
jgi:hypothetical protein